MLRRSNSFTPAMLLMPISIPSPSGYCGATRRMLQSGTTYSAPRSSAATAVSSREARDMGLPLTLGGRLNAGHLCLCLRARARAQRNGGTARRDAYVALHLLVERRAEVGAVE